VYSENTKVCVNLLRYMLATLVLGSGQATPSDEQKSAVVEGRAVNAITGEPVRKATIHLEPKRQKEPSAFIGRTDGNGKFRFKQVPPGEYELIAQKNGYLDASYGAASWDSGGSHLTIKAGDAFTDVKLRLFPAGAIGGCVLDAEGDPVPGAEVHVWYQLKVLGQQKWERGSKIGAGHNGEYRIEGLSPGRYFVSANANEMEGPRREDKVVDSTGNPVTSREVLTYYPDSLTPDEASPIYIKLGQEQSGADIRIRSSRTYRIAGRIAGFAHNPAPDLSVTVWREPSGLFIDEGKISASGEFGIANLTPGTYNLSLSRSQGQTIGKAKIDVTNADQADIVITPYVPAQVKLRIALEGRERPPGLMVARLRKDLSPLVVYCQDGAGTFTDVEPGKYLLDIRGETGTYIKSIRSGDKLFVPESVDITEGEMTLDALLSDGVVEIDGDIKADSAGEPLSSIEVALVHVSSSPAEFTRTARPDQYGHFSFRDLPPGKYRLYAAENVDWRMWNNPDFLHQIEPGGTEIEAHEKDRVHVQLMPIKNEETDRAREKAGLQ
jgi:protocatechuate 3,4-dioxygenase beta subunit